MTTMTDISPLFRHERIALHFSGGKDSLALAHLLRPHWDRITFYHVDTGDLLPEVREIVAGMEALAPRFVRIQTDACAVAATFGQPSDLVPHTGSPVGVLIGGRPIIGRYDCCAHNLWAPMHTRMIEDKITLVIRGTKRVDLRKLPAENGSLEGGYELWLPLQEWSHEDVFTFLRKVGAPICRVYEHTVNAPECATCPAWQSEARAVYLRKFHPDLFAEYGTRLRAVAAEVMPVFAQMRAELEALQ